MEKLRAIGTAALAGVAVLVIAVAGVGVYLTLGSPPQASSSNTTLASTNKSTSLSNSTSLSSSTTSSSTSSTSAVAFNFLLDNTPKIVLLKAGSSVTYPTIMITALPTPASGSETIILNSTTQTGIALKFASNQVQLGTDAKAQVLMTINASQSVTLGDYHFTISGKSGSRTNTLDLKVRVVQYLVIEQGNAFHPRNLTVKQGSMVYWLNFDSPGGGDSGVHNVIFGSGSSAKSPDMQTYDEYSYTFTSLGTYSYFCAYHPGMTGTVTVTS
jgi:plastocyanin